MQIQAKGNTFDMGLWMQIMKGYHTGLLKQKEELGCCFIVRIL
jgi:hypothetical protein